MERSKLRYQEAQNRFRKTGAGVPVACLPHHRLQAPEEVAKQVDLALPVNVVQGKKGETADVMVVRRVLVALMSIAGFLRFEKSQNATSVASM